MRFILFLFIFLLSAPSIAYDPLEGSGLPVPRFASMKSDNSYVRTGPSQDYPIKWIYNRDGLPVEIIQEFDAWRKIKDPNGETGWVNKILLSGKRTVIIESKQIVTAYGSESMERPVAQLEPRVIAEIIECKKDKCEIKFPPYKGWVLKRSLWGVYGHEILN